MTKRRLPSVHMMSPTFTPRAGATHPSGATPLSMSSSASSPPGSPPADPEAQDVRHGDTEDAPEPSVSPVEAAGSASPSASPRIEAASPMLVLEPPPSPRSGVTDSPSSMHYHLRKSSSMKLAGPTEPEPRLGQAFSWREESVYDLCERGGSHEEEFDAAFETQDWPALVILLTAGCTLSQLHRVLNWAIARPTSVELIAALYQALNMSQQIGPPRVFCFSGPQARIEMSGLGPWSRTLSAGGGWSFAAWVWLASSQEPFNLIALLTPERFGVCVTVVFNDSLNVLIEAADERKRDGAKFIVPPDAFKEKTWHHIQIHHVWRRFGASQISLRLDERPVGNPVSLHYPALVTPSFSRCTLFENFKGLTGPVHLFSAPPKAGSMAHLARHQVSPVQAEGEEAIPGSGLGIPASPRKEVSLVDANPPVFLSYHPERTQGPSSIDLAGGHMGELVGVRPWCALSTRDCLRGVGGVAVLLPFLSMGGAQRMIDAVHLIAAFCDAHASNQNDMVRVGAVRMIVCAVEAASESLRRDLVSLEDGASLVRALSALVRAVSYDTVGTLDGARVVRSPRFQLELDVDRELILAYDLWVRCGALDRGCESLLQIISLSGRRVSERPLLFKRKVGVRAVLDSLRRMYRAAQDRLVVDAARMAGKLVVDRVALAIMVPHGTTGITKDEVRAVLDAAVGVHYVGSASSSSSGVAAAAASSGGSAQSQQQQHLQQQQQQQQHKRAVWDTVTTNVAYDALRLLVRLLAHGEKDVGDAIVNANVAAVLAVEVVGFAGVGERVRALALRVIGLCLVVGSQRDSFAKRGGYTYLSRALSFARNATHNEPEEHSAAPSPPKQPNAFASPRPPPSLLRASVAAAAATTTTPTPSSQAARQHDGDSPAPQPHLAETTYSALLSFALTPTGARRGKECRRAVDAALEDAPSEVLDDTLRIHDPHMLAVVLEQLPYMTSFMQQKALQDVFVLLKFEAHNRMQFINVDGWQSALGKFISSVAHDRSVCELGIKVWVLLVADAITSWGAVGATTLDELRALLGTLGAELHHSIVKGALDSIKLESQTPPGPKVVDTLLRLAEDADLLPQLLALIDKTWGGLSNLQMEPETIARFLKIALTMSSKDQEQNSGLGRLVPSLLERCPTFSEIDADRSRPLTLAVQLVLKRVHELTRSFRDDRVTPIHDTGVLAKLETLAHTLQSCVRILGPKLAGPDCVEAATTLHNETERWIYSRWAMLPWQIENLEASWKEAEAQSEAERQRQRLVRSQEKSLTEAKARSELESLVGETEDRAIYLELTRLGTLAVNDRNERRIGFERWRLLLQQLKCGEGLWRESNVPLHWIMPEREDFLRRHLVLDRNLDYVPHDRAAYNASVTATTPPRPAAAVAIEAEEADILLSETGGGGGGIFAYNLEQGEEIVHVFEGATSVTPSVVSHGRVEVTNLHVLFYAVVPEVGELAPGAPRWIASGAERVKKKITERMRWRIDDLLELHSRRHLLRPLALELFFIDQTTAFLAFATSQARDECASVILKQEPVRLAKAFTGSLSPPPTVFRRSKLTELWRKREISTFEYLMHLNTVAGRTYNDVTQYFCFPWILQDYSSASELDLENPATYRDLSKPVGALNPARLAEVEARYREFEQSDMGMPAFHFGTHYSSAGVVLHYLIRIEPYTSLAIELQGGRFDVPDRLFHSVADCFKSCLNSNSDVRELIPEFFYCADMFLNADGLDLGVRQDKVRVENVVLPPWAKGDAHRFVRLHRAALESEHVSRNIHNWIDLIFGYKQRGPAAVAACNVFNHLCYEGAVDIDAIADPVKRTAVELQILEFGQCPSQLLTVPHPPRLSATQVAKLVVTGLLLEARLGQRPEWSPAARRKVVWTPPPAPPLLKKLLLPTAPSQTVAPPLVSVTAFSDRLVCIHADFTATTMYLQEKADGNSVLRAGGTLALPAAPSARFAPRAGQIFNPQCRPEHFAVTQNGNLVLSCEYFDGSVRAVGLDATKAETCVLGHHAPATCIALSQDGRFLVSGSLDGSVVTWSIGGSHNIRDEMLELFGGAGGGSSKAPLLTVLRYLAGHLSSVTSVAVSNQAGLVVSGAQDGRVLLHSLQTGRLVRSLDSQALGGGGCADLVALVPGAGVVISHSRTTRMMVADTVNGQRLARLDVGEGILFVVVASAVSMEVLVCGNDAPGGDIAIRRCEDLVVTRRIAYTKRYKGVRCGCCAAGGSVVYLGCNDGSLVTLCDGSDLLAAGGDGGS